ncbi:MAG TPA: ELM1/GtrOC1 family putative glycosyltransferase [Alphaproteobacteria bacterium]|nr:hypothetical protein [Rhodospirillaceae bacterium]HRJ12418.1 ELM1/GtrOC1 family putative glycosyltransferase [Alphaproteobacteria bacterium]
MACTIPQTNTPKHAWIFSNHETRHVVGKGIGAVNARRGLARALLPTGAEPSLIANTVPCDLGTTVEQKLAYADEYIREMLKIYAEPDFVVTGWGDLEATKMTLALKNYCPDVKIIFIGSQKHLSTITRAERDHLDLILYPDFLIADGAPLPDKRMRRIRYIPHHLVRDMPTQLPQHFEEWISEQERQQFTLMMIGAPDSESYNNSQEKLAAAEIMGHIDAIRDSGRSVMISSSPRTPKGLFHRIQDYCSEDAHIICYEWQANDPNNPYPAVLKHRGLQGVGFTPDSISMPCEALISGAPLFIIAARHYWCDNRSVGDCLTQMIRDGLISHMDKLREKDMQFPRKQHPFCTSRDAAEKVREFFGWKSNILGQHHRL